MLSDSAEKLKILVDGVEEILKLSFPYFSSNYGQSKWELERELALKCLLSEIEKIGEV